MASPFEKSEVNISNMIRLQCIMADDYIATESKPLFRCKPSLYRIQDDNCLAFYFVLLLTPQLSLS